MGMVTLKSIRGGACFRVREKITHPDSLKTYYDVKTYEFNFDNDFKNTVPEETWAMLENEYYDRTQQITYRQLFKIL